MFKPPCQLLVKTLDSSMYSPHPHIHTLILILLQMNEATVNAANHGAPPPTRVGEGQDWDRVSALGVVLLSLNLSSHQQTWAGLRHKIPCRATVERVYRVALAFFPGWCLLD